MTWDWGYAWEILPSLLGGLLLTFEITILAFALAALLGLPWAMAGQSRRWVVRGPIRGVLEFIRGTPLLVQVFLVYYVMPDYGVTISAMLTGVSVLGIHYSTYVAEAYRAGIQAVPRGQWEAARALHLSPGRTWRQIILPPALRGALPPMGSYLIALYKETALLFAIGLPVLLTEAKVEGSATFRLLEPYTLAGLLYLAVSYPSSVLLRRLERRQTV